MNTRQMENKEQHPIYSKSSIEFITIASEYCGYIERQQEFNVTDFIDKTTKLIPLIYLKMSLLPEFTPDLEESPEKFVSEYDYNYMQNGIAEKLGANNDYLEVFHEDMQYSDTPIIAYISENLVDIYQSLKDTISNYDLGSEEAIINAMAECQQNFINYWGQRLTSALKALHYIKYNVNFDEDVS
jgi:hypothetical protein